MSKGKGIAPASRGAAHGPDGKLLLAFYRFADLDQAAKDINKAELDAEVAGDMALAKTFYQQGCAMVAPIHRTIDAMTRLRARTPVGIRAKAAAIRQYWGPEGPVHAGSSEEINGLYWSLIQDLLAEDGAADPLVLRDNPIALAADASKAKINMARWRAELLKPAAGTA